MQGLLASFRPPYSTPVLFALCVLIWGSTWSGVRLQLDYGSPEATVAMRFLLAAALLFVLARIRRVPLRVPNRAHPHLAIQGLLFYCVDYLLVYHAEVRVTSGLVALAYAASPFANAGLGAALAGRPTSRRTLLASAVGICGVVIVFGEELSRLTYARETLIGLALAAAAVLSTATASALTSGNAERAVGRWQALFWGMTYGCVGSTLAAIMAPGGSWVVWSVPSVLTLLYLAVFGSVVTFAAYFVLIERIGLAAAGYIGVAVPCIAIGLSVLLEGLPLSLALIVGTLLCVLGNVLVLAPEGSLLGARPRSAAPKGKTTAMGGG